MYLILLLCKVEGFFLLELIWVWLYGFLLGGCYVIYNNGILVINGLL